MNELDKFLPTPPNLGPPLPSFLQARWPWLKQSSPPPVLAVAAPAPEPAPPAPASPALARLHRASDYAQVEPPPELLHELSPMRVDPSWLQSR